MPAGGAVVASGAATAAAAPAAGGSPAKGNAFLCILFLKRKELKFNN